MKQPAYTHESAPLHVSGEATYIDDIPEVERTLHLALGLSSKAHASILSLDLSAVKAAEGVIAVLTAADIPGENNCGSIIHDDPILVSDIVQYVGQPIFAVVATSVDKARRAARLATITYQDLAAIFTEQEADQAESYVVPPITLISGTPEVAMKTATRRLKGHCYLGGQEHFYLEGQISYALPTEDGGLYVWCSTQHPTEMQHHICHMLGLPAHKVVVAVRRMGGGFGGKESQSGLFACVASLAAHKLGRPVKIRLDRDDDFMITGKRHPFHNDYEVGFNDQGQIEAVTVKMISKAGFSADLSAPVAARAVCHFDNAYYLPHADIKAYSAKTNTQSNTAFRGFGGPQGAFVIETIIDDIARILNLDPLEVRRRNFYGTNDRNVTPYGMMVEDNVIDRLVTELEQSSAYQQRRASIREFNRTSPILKKGIALTPVKFGISFNVTHFNQAGALVLIYTDGTVLLNHGGTEMGQGLHTKIAAIIASELGIDIECVKPTATSTDKIPNTSATAASTGSDINGMAALDAVRQIKARLNDYLTAKHGGKLEDVIYSDNQVRIGSYSTSFTDLVRQAYLARIQLWSDGFYATPKIHWDPQKFNGRPFFYFAYGAAVSEVIIDTLTGESKVIRADLLHEAGNPLNPAIDLGQIEGAFIQGVGWLTSEELWWNKAGKLMTHAPSTYKIPSVNDCPPVLNIILFNNENREDTIYRSKAVGEPPLLLAFSVFFAIRDAIASLADYTINPKLKAPATPESVLNALTHLNTERI